MPYQQPVKTSILVGGFALAIALGASLPGFAENSLDAKMQREIDRGRSLESDVEAELRRQEDLLRSIDLDKETERALEAVAEEEVNLLERANTRIAPRAPVERKLPVSIFESETVDGVLRRSLDADRDGHPEQIRYLDPRTGEMLRKESDRDYDGAIDLWQTYQGGAISGQQIDTNGDGRVDQWEQFSRGRMTEREIDRDTDGHKDAIYKYSGDSLVEERHDHNNDGKSDLIMNYRDRYLFKKQEDRTKNGQIDSWTSYGVKGDRELPIRIERDTNGSGKIDLTETFEIDSGEPVIARREEDKNGDGVTDVISIYENGKLVKREFANPDMVDL